MTRADDVRGRARTWRPPTPLMVGAVALVGYALASLIAPVHDDEPLFADPARSAALGQGFAAPVLDGLLPGAGERLMWQPPGFYVLLAGWFRVLGFGLVQGRLLSAVGAALAVALVYVLARRYASPRAALFAACAVAVAPWTVRAATVIRPDSWSLALVAGTAVATASWLDRRSVSAGVAVAGCGAGAVLMHPIGLLAPAVAGVCLLIRREWRAAVGFPLAAVVLAGLAWAAYVVPLWSSFAAQMAAQGARKTGAGLVTGHVSPRLAVYLVVLLGVLLLWRARGRLPLVPVVATLLAVAAGLVGGEQQYPLYAVAAAGPLAALALDALPLAPVRRVAVALAAAVVCATPSLASLALGASLAGRDAAVAQQVGPVPVYLDWGAAGVYFQRPDGVRVVSPVPAAPGAVERVRADRVVVTSS